MSAGNDDPTRTSRGSNDPALDATELSPGNTASTRLTTDLLPRGANIGRYVVDGELGSGGMGVVYRARDPDLDRELAIKVVQPSASGPRAQERLLAEAKAMAKLRHPAIVPVFDVGTTERGVYVVMPLVAGGTLHDWLRAEKRPWRAVVDKFLMAGRGLVAAHEAGLVHRDFKPKNVLVGETGDAQVADFGLVAETTVPDDGPSSRGRAGVTSVAGTPAYMAPEQASGDAIDARADQYSFCISFWEGLHGERPNEAETRTRGAFVAVAPTRGVHSVPSDRRGAPAWLLAAIARGFASAPERRWPSMSALIRHVEARLRRPQRIAAAAAVFAVLTGGVMATLAITARSATCVAPTARLTGVWDASVRQRVTAAFQASNASMAGETLARILPALDRYAGAWIDAHRDACEDTQVRRTQSADLLDRRMVCLDRRLSALGALTGALASSPQAEVIQRATDAVAELPAIEDCDDRERLLAAVPLPANAATRAGIVELEHELDRVAVLELRGERKAQLEAATAAVTRARSVGYAPLLSRALRTLSIAQQDQSVSSEATLRELTKVAAEAHDDRQVAIAWASLVNDLTVHEARFAEAKALEPVAEAALIRAGSPTDLRVDFLTKSGARAANAGEMKLAIERLRSALPIASEAKQLVIESLLARALAVEGDQVGAKSLAEKVVAASDRRYGPNHPETARATQFLSQTLGDLGEFDRAEALLQRTLAIQIDVFGDNNADVGMTLYSLGNQALNRGRYAQARSVLARAAHTLEVAGDERRQALALTQLAKARHMLGEPIQQTRGDHERALELFGRAMGVDNQYYAFIEINFANDLADARLCSDARPLQTHALETLTKQQPGAAVPPLKSRAQCAASEGKYVAAVADLDRAIALCRAQSCATWDLEAVLDDLGRLLIAQKLDRPRGLRLLREARDGYQRTGKTHLAAEIDAWLAKHPK